MPLRPRPRTCGLIVALLLLCAAAGRGYAQEVYGRITDERGGALAYATVSVAGGQGGTTTSLDGEYSLTLGGEGGTLTVRYVGYAPERVAVAAKPARQRLDVALAPAAYELEVATVRSGAEDPAYRIMREAAARREGYLRADERYEVDVYVKGLLRVDEAPEKIMGQEIGDMGGLLDSSRAGIVYLSETFSTLQFEQPDRFRETVTASKVSGDPRGYSFNSSVGVDFDLYRRTTDYSKPILSPLAERAPNTYRFELQGARRGAAGRLVYRIGVAPRDRAAPAYAGTLYVEDSTYHLLDADLYLLGAPLNADGLDTLYLAQSYERRADGGWQVLQRRLEPVIDLIGFRFRGAFTAVYSDYDFAPAWPTSPFGKTVTEVLPESNAVDSAVWEARPIALTPPELRDYYRKDSIRRHRSSPAYRDSVQARGNKFGWGALLTGYTYRNWRRDERLTFSSVLTNNGFNAVAGAQLGVGVAYARGLGDDLRRREFEVGGALSYGFADERLYPRGEFAYRYNATYGSELRLSGGRELADFHRLEPVGSFWNTNYHVFGKRNPRKLYERRFVALEHATDLRDGEGFPVARLSTQLSVARRLGRDIASDYSLLKKDRTYTPNAPRLRDAEDGQAAVYDSLGRNTVVQFSGRLTHTPRQRFSVRPGQYTPLPNAWPTLELDWRYGRRLDAESSEPRRGATATEFLFAQATLRRTDLQLGRAGKLGARVSVGAGLLYRGAEHTIDLHQFAGSELNVNAFLPYLDRYLALPHYGFTTRDTWVDGVVEHNFNGALWRRLPLLGKLGFETIVRTGAIVLPEEGRLHQEFGIGVGRVGFGPARFIRVDVAWRTTGSFRQNTVQTDWRRPVYRIGINVPLGTLTEGGEVTIEAG